MDPERWRQIEALYNAALERSPTARAAFLAHADAGLRAEVESLLAQNSGEEATPTRPAWEGAEPFLDATSEHLAVGAKLGPYRIEGPLGAGGMGEVYRATDTRLRRTVAIKTSKEQFSERFEREARAVAALNHPNICTLHDVGPNYLVMELIEGQTLSERIKQGAIPLEEALPIAKQIGDALEAAHEKGIVHRDLKPSNVKITPEGTVKVLDFGLAKLGGTPTVPSDNSPTLTIGATEAGVILGTAAYMSPEQAKGKAVDKRADIWSFGVVLYEMLTGQRLFEGETVSDILAGVIKQEPDFSRVPAKARPLLQACLTKDPKKRLRDIGDVWRLLEQGAAPQAVRVSKLPWALAAVLGLAALGLTIPTILHFRETPPLEPTMRLSIALPEGSQIHSFALSPDGQTVAIAAVTAGKSQLWLRPVDALRAQPVAFTEDAAYPFWSPDGRFIGFFAQGKLKKISAAGGGSPQLLCNAPEGRGGAWNRDDVIVFFSLDTDFRVGAAGGVPTPLSTAGMYPGFLPDGQRFLTYVRSGRKETGIYVVSVDGKEERRILMEGSPVLFAPAPRFDLPSHLLFVRENNLMAVTFDATTAQLTGEPFPLVEGVSFTSNLTYLPVTVSQNGTLLYATKESAGGGYQFEWLDRAGKRLGTVGESGPVMDPALDPSMKFVAFRRGSATSDLWIRELVRGTETRLTNDPSINAGPLWSTQGDQIVFGSSRGSGLLSIYQKAVNGSGKDELLLKADGAFVFPVQWSRDGRFLVYVRNGPKLSRDLWVLPMDVPAAERKPIPFLQSEFNEMHGQISPDGHWMVFSSDRSGRPEVYVRPFPSGDGEHAISTTGGEMPRWRGDGKELFFEAAGGKLMSVLVKNATTGASPSFDTQAPTPLFDVSLVHTTAPSFQYDVTPDGQRFLINSRIAVTASTPLLTVVTNWQAGLKK